jgi:hypothetical protein
MNERQFLRLASALLATGVVSEPTWVPPRGCTYTNAQGATPEQIAEVNNIIQSHNWDDAAAQASWEQQQNALAAAALLQSPDAIPRAVRASDAVSYQLRNNVAELLGVVIDHVDELAAMQRANRQAAILAWIAADRAAWEQAGGVWAEPPPAPSEVYATGTDRVQRDELLPMVGAAVAAGA